MNPALDISFKGFAEEVLFGRASPRTHLFEDDAEGSYHVDPPEVTEGLFKAAQEYGLDLEAVVVIGPIGPLWSYEVVSIAKTPECSRVNWLTMPHARITLKRSGCVVDAAVSAFMEGLKVVAPSDSEVSESCVVVARAGSQRWARLDCVKFQASPELDDLQAIMKGLGKHLELTYSAYPPVVKR